MFYYKFNLFKSIVLKLFYGFIFLLIVSSHSFSQTNYLMSVDNAELVNKNTYEFEVYIKSTDNSFVLSSYQCAFDFNGVNDGGTLNLTYLSGSSQLTNIPCYSVGIYQYGTERELTFASGYGSDSIFATVKRVGRFRLQNTSGFSVSLFQILWKFQGFINTILIDSDFNVITNPAYHLNLSISDDTVPPSLISASLNNSDTVLLNFSEQILSLGANNAANYIIDNGITVINAALSQGGTTVTLKTTPHISGQKYNVQVNNISDLAGNIISPSANSYQYSYYLPDNNSINVKIFLQGPFNSGYMEKSLNTFGFVPKNQPYNTSPWNYTGTESVDKIPADVVDWVLIELRNELSGSSTIYTRAAFIKTDGRIVDLDGISKVKTETVPAGNYYIVIKHRNHLAVMSAVRIELSGNPSLYDFTTASENAYGSGSQVKLGNGIYGMYTGDSNSNGIINNSDANSIWKQQNGQLGYYDGDSDMNGGVNIVDKNEYMKKNQNTSTNVPN